MRVFDKAKVWLRERNERAAERKAEKRLAKAHDPHAHSRFWLLNVPALATICAAIVEWYWAMLFCIEATGELGVNWSTSMGSNEAAIGSWHFVFDVQSVAVLIGLIFATIPIVMLSMVWLPVQFAMRGAGRWRRGTVITVGLLANILVIVSGTVVMNYNRQEQVREGLVVEQQAAANRGAIEAQIAAVNDDLARLTDRRVNNEYAATAANVGAEAYRAQYMSPEALARSPAMRRDIIVRALGAAERADALRAERASLFQQLASAPTEAAVAANVEDNVGRELNTFAQYVEVWRPPFVALICTLIGIFGAWWTLAMLERLNPKDVLRSGWADEGHRIEDMTDQPSIVPEPMEPAREVVTDAETGEELVKIKPKAYWRKRVTKKGKPTKVRVEPDAQDDEPAAREDGGGRRGSAAVPRGFDGISDEPQNAEPQEEDEAYGENADGNRPEIMRADGSPSGERTNDDHNNQHHESGDASGMFIEQPEPSSDLSEEEAQSLLDAAADDPVIAGDEEQENADSAEPDQSGESEHYQLPENEGVMHGDAEEEREPETRPERMIAAAE